MQTNVEKAKFLSQPEDLGIVAVGFSRGQVCPPPLLPSHPLDASLPRPPQSRDTR